MKILLIIFIGLFTIVSCKSDESNIYQDVDLDVELKVDIQYIKSISVEGFTSFDMDELYDKSESFSRIEDLLTVKSIENTHVNNDTNWNVYSEYYGFQAYQWDELEGNFCFTFFKQNEECCLTQYCVVTNQDGRIKSINFFGTAGGDGGWRVNTEGVITHPGTYHIYEDNFEHDYVTEVGEGVEIENQTHIEYMLRFKDSLFIKGKTIKEYIKSDTSVVSYGC